MEQTVHNTEAYDYRQYDRIWQRVAPNLEPYPAVRSAEGAAVPAMAEQAPPPGVSAPGVSAPGAPAAPETPEGQLPGAEMNPCCMGSAAAEMLEVLTGFIEEELSDRRYFLAMIRQAPSWARQRLREIANEQGGRAKRLMAVYYLITGECYRPAISTERIYVGRWCAALRERYHAEACNGLNYARAADGTTDPCLAKLLNDLSADAYRRAEELLRMLERSLQS
ncbi:MAG: ferritin-like domain-containing protein [Oscillospiraceae bacterium]|nr:ferritin-like domain-containing protein [Oscillospiraceae bacterium]